MLSFAKKTYSNATNDCSETRFERYLDTWKYRSEKTLNPDAFYTVNDLNFPYVSDKSPDHEKYNAKNVLWLSNFNGILDICLQEKWKKKETKHRKVRYC